MKLKNYLKDLCQEDTPNHNNIRMGDIQCKIDEILLDIKQVIGHGYVKFVYSNMQVPRRTFSAWRCGSSPIPLPFLLSLLNTWKETCNKGKKSVDLKLSECFNQENYFSVMFGHKVKLPKFLNVKLAYLLGNLFGDGWLTDYKKRIETRGKPEYPIGFASGTFGFLEEVIAPYFKELFGVDLKVYKQGNCFTGKISAKPVYFFLHKICEMPLGKKKGKLKIPKIIKTATKEIQRNFIAGFFDADGCLYVKRKNVSVTQADDQILNEFAELINSLGIITGKIHKTQKEFGITYNLTISWKSVKEFLEMIPFRDAYRGWLIPD